MKVEELNMKNLYFDKHGYLQKREGYSSVLAVMELEYGKFRR